MEMFSLIKGSVMTKKKKNLSPPRLEEKLSKIGQTPLLHVSSENMTSYNFHQNVCLQQQQKIYIYTFHSP